MRRYPQEGEKVCVKGYENLPFMVVAVDKGNYVNKDHRPVQLAHPLTGGRMWFARGELSKWRDA